MTERERWIVYPLLFFALGAALRDKFTHTVQTDELRAGRILCDELVASRSVTVYDPQNLARPLAQLTSSKSMAPGSNKRLGSLLLTDSEGRDMFWLADDQIKTRLIECEGVRVIDPDNPSRTLAALATDASRGKDGKPERYGILALNNREYNRILGNPLPAPAAKPAPQGNAQDSSGDADAAGASAANAADSQSP
jgi:hypothetical protein